MMTYDDLTYEELIFKAISKLASCIELRRVLRNILDDEDTEEQARYIAELKEAGRDEIASFVATIYSDSKMRQLLKYELDAAEEAADEPERLQEIVTAMLESASNISCE